MTSTSPAPPDASSPPPGGLGGNWPNELAGRLESVVGSVRDKTTVPAFMAARAVVYGAVLGVLGAALAVLLIIAVVRLLDVYLPFHPVGRRVWVVDAAASAIFLGLGAFLWRRRRPRTK
ncbi:MAG TPA: hypothetical protein VG435_03820 [Acidimicrobiales bacterium]|jgi:hypothetical protein|nr:hypothetical protein [Acidimicrobiales bacterium]